MKKLFLLAAAAVLFASCTQVKPGEFALKTYQFGSKKGQMEVKEVGRYANNWFGKFTYTKYPATVQQHSWVGDEMIRFQAEGQVLRAEVGIEYEFLSGEQERLSMYKYFKRSPDQIVQDFIRKDVVSAFNKVTQNMTVEEVYSTKKDSVRGAAQQIVYDKYIGKGIKINDITYLSDVIPPDKIKAAIDAQIEAKTIAITRENEIAQTKAEAQKKIEAAHGNAESARIEAEGRAKAMDIEGAALRRNPQILELKRVQNQGTMAESASGWSTAVLSANQTQMLLGVGNGSK